MDSVSLELASQLELTQHDFWNISRQTAEFISMLIKISKPQKVLEVGTSNGYSAMWIADALKAPCGVPILRKCIDKGYRKIAIG